MTSTLLSDKLSLKYGEEVYLNDLIFLRLFFGQRVFVAKSFLAEKKMCCHEQLLTAFHNRPIIKLPHTLFELFPTLKVYRKSFKCGTRDGANFMELFETKKMLRW